MSAAVERLLRGGPAAVERIVDDYRERALPLVARTAADDFRAAWQALAGLDVLRLPADGARDGAQADTDGCAVGPVTRSLAAVEGIGLAGVDPGLCYALTSQLVGMQYPLRDALSGLPGRTPADIADGAVLLCHALTERGGGSDPFSMRTTARRDGDGYALDGAKTFVTAAPVADLAVVFARTGAGRSPFALSAFLVPVPSPGVTRGETFDKTALPTVPMGELLFDQARLPACALIGEEGSGLAVMASTTAWERALIMGYALGPMRLMLRRTVEWADQREHFERRMGASHQVAARVSDMAMALHRSRTQLYAMAAALDAGTPARQLAAEASLTKISVSEDYVRMTEHATALSGVRAFLPGSPLPADLHSPMAALTYAGPNDLLRVGVARQFGLPVEN
ncbi:acyl-CoA dehydrogenase family protein [Streptantibioticus parmotrematis]|uniref:acyl-CoA dehydrogenase family protein n=1 Tax=Streptantibioticus parmotrematis TaxID=2873249 RepID=UPI0027DF02BB|nr:acyl-CoA dehydrogenase [Streptantibioticus parmotrematis]